MALSWRNLPCVLNAAIGIGKRTLASLDSLPRPRGRIETLGGWVACGVALTLVSDAPLAPLGSPGRAEMGSRRLGRGNGCGKLARGGSGRAMADAAPFGCRGLSLVSPPWVSGTWDAGR